MSCWKLWVCFTTTFGKTGLCDSSRTWKLWGQGIYKACEGSLPSFDHFRGPEVRKWQSQSASYQFRACLGFKKGFLPFLQCLLPETGGQIALTKQVQDLILSVEQMQKIQNIQLLEVSWYQGCGSEYMRSWKIGWTAGKDWPEIVAPPDFLISLDLESIVITVAGRQC